MKFSRTRAVLWIVLFAFTLSLMLSLINGNSLRTYTANDSLVDGKVRNSADPKEVGVQEEVASGGELPEDRDGERQSSGSISEQTTIEEVTDPIKLIGDLSGRNLTIDELQKLIPTVRKAVLGLAGIVQKGAEHDSIRAVRALGAIGTMYAQISPSILKDAEIVLLKFYEKELDVRAKFAALDVIGLLGVPEWSTIDAIVSLPPEDPALMSKFYSILPLWFDIHVGAKTLYLEALEGKSEDRQYSAVSGISAAIAADPSICQAVLDIVENGPSKSTPRLLLELFENDLPQGSEVRLFEFTAQLASDKTALESDRDIAVRILLAKVAEESPGGEDCLKLSLQILADPTESERLRATIIERLKKHHITTNEVLVALKSVSQESSSNLSEKALELLRGMQK